MAKVDLSDLRRSYEGTEYRKLIEHHIRRQSLRELDLGARGTIGLIPSALHADLTHLVDEWNETARYEEFWKTDAALVLDLMLEAGRELFSSHDLRPADDDLFNVFQVFVLTHAMGASEHPEIRRFAGIRKGLFG